MFVGYARVSTLDQNLDRQLDQLIAYGVDKRNIYQEKITGTKKDRPELMKMINELEKDDIVVIVDLTRLSRSTKDLFTLVDQIEKKGANIKSLKESWLDTTTPQGKLMFTFIAGISQFERDLTSQRTREGLAAAKARGRKGGRPSKRNKKADLVEMMLKNGYKINDIVNETGLSRMTVYRIINDKKKEKGEE